MLGIKRGNGASVTVGAIIVRQRGTQWHAGPGVGLGKDHTLYALKPGRVFFRYDLESSRKIVLVSDESGLEVPMVGFGSRTETKQQLADAIDADKYLSLGHLDRLLYVKETAQELLAKKNKEKTLQMERRLDSVHRRRFDLVDLSLV
jgi:large subunit ribosomal protein L27